MTLFLICSLFGCTDMPIVKGMREVFNLSRDPVVVQRTIDDDARIKAMVAKLQDIPVTDKEQQIELQAGLAYLSLFAASTSFVNEAKRLVELTNGIDIEQLNPQVQAILHLANNAGVEGSDAIKIPRERQNVVDSLCASDSNSGLGRMTHDLSRLSKNFYQWKMTLACYELIRDKSPPDIARHLAVVPVVVGPNQPCLFVKKSGVVILVASWFTCALQQKGIDMNSLLESIQSKHHRIYEEALLEAGMPFRYPNELLTMRP